MKDRYVPEGKIPLVAACDIESTLTPVEGWDFLAEMQSPEIQAEIRKITNQAMNGEISFEEALRKRFDIINPGLCEIKILQDEYLRSINKDVVGLINFLRAKFARVVLISGGLEDALLPLAKALEIPREDLFSIPLTKQGQLPATHNLYRPDGKKIVLGRIIAEEKRKRDSQNKTSYHNIMIGDGMTDARCKGSDVTFIAIGNREKVIKAADFHIETLGEIYPLILNPYSHEQIRIQAGEADCAR